MAIYSKTARQMLVDLINEGNPDLPFKVDLTNFEFTHPTVIGDLENGHNTQIRVIAKPSSPYVGNTLLTYRRLDLGKLFEGVLPTVQRWVYNTGNPDTGTPRAQLHDLLPLYTKKYGITLEASQVWDRTLTEAMGVQGTPFQITAEPNSLVYIGHFDAVWFIGKRTLDDLVQIEEINGRQYPGGNEFADPSDRKLYFTPLTYATDYTYMLKEYSNWDYGGDGERDSMSLNTGNTIDKANTQRILNLLNETLPASADFSITNRSGHYTDLVTTGTVSVSGIWRVRVDLPSVDYPEANSEFYNTAVILLIPEDCGWTTGNIYLHYNT